MSRFAPSPAAHKPFSWSYSKLKNYETCNYRHQQIDLDKTVVEPESDELRDGNDVHFVLASALGKGVALPPRHARLQPWVERLTFKSNEIGLVEQQLAIAEDRGPCEWFAGPPRHAWCRAKVDYLKIVGPVALAIDWKTGKRLDDSVQLALTAALVFAHYPQVQRIRTEFVWLKEGVSLENTTREDFAPSDMPDLWAALEPRIEAMRYSWENKQYPPMPGRLCGRYCPVEHCEYHGRRF